MSVNRKNRVVQVTNVSPSATSEQLRTLFGHVGVLEEVVVYPSDDKEELASKVCYIRYQEPINAEVALHLNNTVFLDRALIVLPLSGDRDTIPDEKYANLVRAPPNTAAGVLPRTADWPLDVISMVVGRPGEQVIHTMEPRLSSLAFPLYPPLPATTDGSRIEEIRRTILVTNLDPKTTGDQVLEFFNKHAEVRCVRMAGTDFDRAAYVEFTQQPSIIKAFGLMGATLNGRQIMVQHSNCAIIKPANNVAMLDETSKRSATNEQASSVGGHSSKNSDRRRSRSRSRARRSRSRRRSTSRRYRSRSRDRRRSHSRHSRDRRRSPTQSRSRSRGHRHRTRSRSRDYRRSDHARSRSHNRKKHRHSRSHSSRRYSRSRSKGHRGDHRDRQNRNTRERDRTRDRDRDREKIREREREKERERNRGPDRRDREKYRHSERDSDDRRDSKPKKHRDVPTKQSHSNGAVRQEKREKNPEVNNRSSATLDEVQSSKKSKHTDSISSCSDSEDENSKICPAESMENGKTQSDDDTQSSNEQPPKPTVVGVKLAGPEDMDHLSPDNVQSELPLISHISPESDSSGEAMDTEA
ncbi:putative sfrs11 protein [Schistosoma mansoni]|uniref:Putative sfrs11 protein n=3 Tax=Schistosoma mansoni TaxID=6183 RepID=G4V7Z2_SCHMA|nr:putative sfrs11 protein [Schistosoma mansoni]|eukprot:XP_018647874.1 putative sfrs11 protein [Schistosoma mansoni]